MLVMKGNCFTKRCVGLTLKERKGDGWDAAIMDTGDFGKG